MTAKLLLADDSVTIQRVIELTFADENVEVVAVGDGKEAIERLKSDRPDIVLADIGMPERDGYEVAAFIKGNPELSHIPVLLLTGAFEPIDEARARSVGCEGVLIKPFEPQMVISRVRELLNRVAGSGRKTDTPVPPAEAKVPAPQAPAAAQPPIGPESLQDYFDRLDAALSTLTTTPPPLEPTVPEPAAPAQAQSPERKPAPTIAKAPAAQASAAAPSSTATSTMPSLYDAFTALLAAERGQPLQPGMPASEPLPAIAPPSSASISEEVIDDIVGRVLARMGDEETRRAVLDTAERLVRQEIERIKTIAD